MAGSDTGVNPPAQGHGNNTTESSQQNPFKKVRDLENQTQQNSQEDNSAGQPNDQQQQTETQEGERKYAGKYNSPEEMEKGYKKLESKLGQRNEKAQKWEQWESFLKQKPEAAEVVKEISQNPQFQQFYQQYKQGNLDPNNPNQQQPNNKNDRLSRLRERLNKSRGNNSQQTNQQYNTQFQQAQQQDYQNQQGQQAPYEDRLNRTEQMVKGLAMQSITKNVKEDYNRLQTDYGEIIEQEGLNMEDLVKVAADHNLRKEDGQPIPDVEKALKFHLATSPNNFADVVQTLQQMGQKQAKHNHRAKQQGQVESTSPAQSDANTRNLSPAEEIKQRMINVGRTSGSGFPRKQ